MKSTSTNIINDEHLAEKRRMIRDAAILRERLLDVRDAVIRGNAGRETIFLALNDATAALLVHCSMLEMVCAFMEKFADQPARKKLYAFPARKNEIRR